MYSCITCLAFNYIRSQTKRRVTTDKRLVLSKDIEYECTYFALFSDQKYTGAKVKYNNKVST